jgi:hypothetical protein
MNDGSTTWLPSIIASLVSVLGWVITYFRATGRNDEKIATLERKYQDITELVDSVGRGTGETMQAIRQKLTDMEIWGRDNFVRRSDFATTVEGIHRDIATLRVLLDGYGRDLGSKIDNVYDRLEAKIDKIK